MGRFSGVNEAKFNEGGVYFLPGNYLVRVDAAKVIETRKNGDGFVVETTILESDNPERRRGSGCSWMTTEDKDSYLGNVNHYCSVALDIDPTDVDEAGVEMVISEDNPTRGTILKVQATNIKTREGKDFTKVVFKRPDAADFARLGLKPDGKTPLEKTEEKKSAYRD